ncbi:MAG: glycosyltransferase [Clostridia bacterium]|nr:glycosyltransferase [Clostridia bacterium]
MSKILYAASNMTHINNFHLGYIAALRENGHTVSVMARGEGADYDIPFEKKLFSAKNTACRRRIREIIKKERFDAVILNTTLAAFHIRLALPRSARPRVINIVHGYLFSKNTGFIKKTLLSLCERLVAKRTDAIIVMNSEDRGIAEKMRLCRGKISSVDGVGVAVRDIITPPSEIKKAYGEGKYSLLFVGELSARKNQELLIRALPKIREKIPNAVLWLVGDGALREELEKLAEKLGCADFVTFFGKRVDACDFMRACDLYVSAAKIEGLPFNVVEALGCGCYTVISDIKGHCDVVNSTRVGTLYPEGDASAFTEAVCTAQKAGLSGSSASQERYAFFEKKRVFPLVLETIEAELK